MKVATFNCNGNGQNPMKHIKGREYMDTMLLQKAVEENLASSNKSVKEVVGSSLDFLPVHEEIAQLFQNWLSMNVAEFYANKEIAAWRLTTLLDLQTNGVIYPWKSLSKLDVMDVDEIICSSLRPVPEKYNLPPTIARHSEILQRIATHCLVQVLWEVTPLDLLVKSHAQMRVYMDTIDQRTVDQIIECCDDHDFVFLQEVTLLLIKKMNILTEYEIIYKSTPDAGFYSAIAYKGSRDILLGEWAGNDRFLFCSFSYKYQMYALGSIHAISNSGQGAVESAHTLKEFAADRGIERVVLAGDANTVKGDSRAKKDGTLVLGSTTFREKLKKAEVFSCVMPMWFEETQASVKSSLQPNGTKAGTMSMKACDFIATNCSDAGYRIISDEEADLLPSRNHVSDHKIVSAVLNWK